MGTTIAIGYARVSTEEQASSGLSLDAQRERIRAYCVARGWELADVIVDAGASAKSLDRPGMRKVLMLMRERLVDGVVALKLDRLTRSVTDLHELLRTSDASKVALVSVTENLDTSSAGGRLMLNVLAAMAEWEREVIAERTSAALRIKRDRGERVSFHATMGTAEGERGRKEREAIEYVRKRLDERGWVPKLSRQSMYDQLGRLRISLRDLSRELAERGLVNRSGLPYHPSSISRMISSIQDSGEPGTERPARASAPDDGRRLRLVAALSEVAA